MNEIVQEKPLPLACGCPVSAVDSPFFAKKPAAARAPKPAAVEPDYYLSESPPPSP